MSPCECVLGGPRPAPLPACQILGTSPRFGRGQPVAGVVGRVVQAEALLPLKNLAERDGGDRPTLGRKQIQAQGVEKLRGPQEEVSGGSCAEGSRAEEGARSQSYLPVGGVTTTWQF